jgi:selenophosphate synthetase-related protein
VTGSTLTAGCEWWRWRICEIAFGDSAVIIRMDSDPFLVVSAEGVKHG